jgi:hypothetical protein
MHISGNNFQFGQRRGEASYFTPATLITGAGRRGDTLGSILTITLPTGKIYKQP